MTRPLWRLALGIVTTALFTLALLEAEAQAPAAGSGSGDGMQWPRTFGSPQGQIVVYQPTLESWDQTELKARTAVAITPSGASQAIIGAVYLSAKTVVDKANRTVTLSNLQITKANFPGAKDPATLEAMLTKNLPQQQTVSLDSLLAGLKLAKEQEKKVSVPVKNPVPQVLVSYSPAILVLLDGQPKLNAIPGTGLQQVINTSWTYLYQESTNTYWLLHDKQWLKSAAGSGTWTESATPPPGLNKAPAGSPLAQAAAATPATGQPVPAVFIEDTDSALIVFEGEPKFEAVGDTGLTFASNTENDVFQLGGGAYYVLLAGRWFTAGNLNGPWSYVAPDQLPPAFGQIPGDSPAARVLTSVPGSVPAQESVILATIPTTATVKRSEAKLNVTYVGQPEFVTIEGTSMQRAVNTPETVLLVNGKYYSCQNAIWFVSNAPTGPWVVCDSVPEVIYTIPPSDPAYPVTYVYVYGSNPEYVQTGYTAGYLGGFVTGLAVGALLVYGTGWYYHPWYGGGCWYGHSWTYGRGAYYNPWTGGWAYRGHYATPYYATRSAGAYNPWTGNYAYGHREVTPYGAWGHGVVGNVDSGKWAEGAYHVGPRGGVAGYETSSGNKGVAYRTPWGATAHTNNADYYVGKDGNIYKRQDGNWYKDDGGNWANAPGPQTRVDNARQYNQDVAQNEANKRADQEQNAKNDIQQRQNQNNAQQQAQQRQQERQRADNEPATAQRPQERTQQPVQRPSDNQYQDLERQYQDRQRSSQQYNDFRQNRESYRDGGGARFGGGGFRGGGRR